MTLPSLKKMIYAANHRGTKENDLLLGGFAKAHLESLNGEDQQLFAALLEELDGDIYEWFLLCRQQDTDKSLIPSQYHSLLHHILSSHASN